MRTVILSIAVLCAATMLMAAGLAPLGVKPGVWQVTMTSRIGQLPAPHTSTYKSCVRKQDLDQYPFTDPEAHCSWTVVSSTGSRMEANGMCRPEGMGDVTFNMRLEALDAENVKGTGQLVANGPAGPMNGQYSGTAKWLGATCPAGIN